MNASRTLALSVLAVLVAGCNGLSDADAIKLVRDYDRRVAEAFRTGDARVVDPVTGPTDGKRITGLIGVKLDQGLTLDSELVSFTPLRIAREGDQVAVFSEERWTYRYRRIGSGQRVGPDSQDHYFMSYHLERIDGRWVVAQVAFERPPEVGRDLHVLQSDLDSMHGVDTVERPSGPAAGGAGWSPPRFGGRAP